MTEIESMEAAWIRRARAGDPGAFRAIVAAHSERVYGLALRLMGDESDAMDLVQDVFVQAWDGLDRFRGASSLLTWLQGMTVRMARQRWRRRKRRADREDRYVRERYLAAVRAAMPEAMIDLERAMADLPVRMRTALVLHCIEGFPQREVAELMGISEGTVKAHVHAARKALEEKLEP